MRRIVFPNPGAFILVVLSFCLTLLPAARVTAETQAGYSVSDNGNRPDSPIVEGTPRRYRIVLKGEFHIRENPGGAIMKVTLPLPADTDSQKILHWSVHPRPTGEIVSKYGYRFLSFELGPGVPGEKLSVRYEAEVELRRVRYEIDPAKVGSLKDIPPELVRDYTVDGPFYNLDSPVIQKALKEAVGEEKNPYFMALNIWNFSRSRLFYKGDGRKVSAARTLRLGHGSCTEYTFVMIALCRAAGLPARYISGSIPRVGRHRKKGFDISMHKVGEVYIPGYGWVTMESSGGVGIYGKDMSKRYFACSSGRLLNFVYEPEPGLLSLDPRRNTLSYRPTDNDLDYYGEITGHWTLLNTPQKPSMEDDFEEEEPGEEDPGEY